MRWTARLRRFFAGCPLTPRAPRSARLGLEGLEARLTPSTFNVIAGGGSTTPAGGSTPTTALTATAASLNNPVGVAIDGSGNVYIADANNNLIEKVTAAGVLSVIAGGGSTTPVGGSTPTTGLTATAASLDFPYGVAVDASGNVYIADEYHSLIEKVNTSGALSVIAGGGTTTPVGGSTPTTGLNATAAQLSLPTGVAVDASGNVYITDTNHSLIEEVNTSGVLSVTAGGGTAAPANGISPTAAQLSNPQGVAVDGSGNVYIADTQNSLIEAVAPALSPAFSGLSGPSITYGTATATLTGTLAAGSTDVASATVSVTIGGSTQTTTTNSNGQFSLAFPTTSLSVSGSPYTVTYSYAGSNAFNAATDSSTTLAVTQATPTVLVTDAGGTYTGSPFAASGTVNGSATLETVGLTYAYYAGSTATGTPLSGAPTAVGTYTAVAAFAGSTDYTTASATTTFTIAAAAPTSTTISGTVFRDFNADGALDGSGLAADYGLAGRTVFLDLNGTGTLTAGDPTAVTDAGGNYTLTGVPAGTYTVRVVLTALDQLAGSTLAVTAAGAPLTAQDIGLRPNSSVLPVAVSPNLFANTAPAGGPGVTYAQGLYGAVLGRTPDAGELAAAQQTFGAQDAQSVAVREQDALSILGSNEYFTSVVEHDYQLYLGRAATSGEAAAVSGYVAQLQGGVGANQVAVEFLTSAEFAAAHADNAAFVQALFQDVLGRTGSAAEVQAYVQMLGRGVSRAAVVGGFVNSAENARITVQALYAQYLQRSPDQSGEPFYVQQILTGTNLRTVAAEILSSTEFAADLGVS
jgi:hypothetical protein